VKISLSEDEASKFYMLLKSELSEHHDNPLIKRLLKKLDETLPKKAKDSAFAEYLSETFEENPWAELPGTKLVETIDNFHHTPTRIQQLEDAIRINHEGRADVCKAEIEFARSIYSVASAFVDGMANGTILIRVSHNDTKINNVMFDFTGPEEIAMVVIDLDTVMPGTMLYDFGDLVRTSTWPGREDEPDPSKVYVSMALFEELVKGWSRSVGHIMTPAEIDNMALSGKIITYNIGIRFLADYFRGDTYFNIQRPDQNLERARVQFAMIQSMDKQRNEMEEIVRKHASKI